MNRNRFNGFVGLTRETVKTVSKQELGWATGLKPGENKKNFKAAQALLLQRQLQFTSGKVRPGSDHLFGRGLGV